MKVRHIDKAFYDRIRHNLSMYIGAVGCSQRELAEWTGFSQGYISKILTGILPPSLEFLYLVAEYFNEDIAFFLKK